VLNGSNLINIHQPGNRPKNWRLFVQALIILSIVFLASPLVAQELKGTLQQIKKSGKIRIGYREAQPPMSFLDKDGAPAGYSVDVCKEGNCHSS
jgi:ABC-type amino acid transport substrate-binding protein